VSSDLSSTPPPAQEKVRVMKTLVKVLVRIVVLWGRAHRLPVVD
jgi:hypothetical protein